MTNNEKQARHRYYKKLAIEFYQDFTGIEIKEIMDFFKLKDIADSVDMLSDYIKWRFGEGKSDMEEIYYVEKSN